jgi:hypothetical protein
VKRRMKQIMEPTLSKIHRAEAFTKAMPFPDVDNNGINGK